MRSTLHERHILNVCIRTFSVFMIMMTSVNNELGASVSLE